MKTWRSVPASWCRLRAIPLAMATMTLCQGAERSRRDLLERLRDAPARASEILVEAGRLERSERLAFLREAGDALGEPEVSSAVFRLGAAGETTSAVWALEIVNHLPRGHEFRLLGFDRFAELTKKTDALWLLRILKNRGGREDRKLLETWLRILSRREKDTRLAGELWRIVESPRIEGRIRALAARALEGHGQAAMDRKMAKQYLLERDGDVRSGILHSFSPRLDPRYLNLLVESLETRRGVPPEEALGALRLAAWSGSESGLQYLRDAAIYQKSVDLRIRAVEHLARYSAHPAFMDVVGEIQELQIEEAEVRTQMWVMLLEALSSAAQPGAADLLVRATTRPELRLRLWATYLLRGLPRDRQLVEYTRLLDDPSPHVVAAAVWGLIGLRAARAADALLDHLRALSRLGGLPFRDAVRFLARFTEVDHAHDVDAWLRWRAEHSMEDREVGGSRQAPGPSDDRHRRTEVRKFFEHRVVSRHPVFVVDVSGRMGQVEDFYSRAELLYIELAGFLRSLGDGATFGIVAFNDRVHVLPGGSRGATPGELREAIDFLRKLGTAGDADLRAALEAALAMDGVDTIYLLSGGTSRSRSKEAGEDLAAWFRRENETRGLILNTIGLGGGSDLLRRLALDNDGIYKTR